MGPAVCQTKGPQLLNPTSPPMDVGTRTSPVKLQPQARTVAAGSLAALWRMMKSDEFNRLIGVDEIRQKQSTLYGSLRDR